MPHREHTLFTLETCWLWSPQIVFATTARHTMRLRCRYEPLRPLRHSPAFAIASTGALRRHVVMSPAATAAEYASIRQRQSVAPARAVFTAEAARTPCHCRYILSRARPYDIREVTRLLPAELYRPPLADALRLRRRYEEEPALAMTCIASRRGFAAEQRRQRRTVERYYVDIRCRQALRRQSRRRGSPTKRPS